MLLTNCRIVTMEDKIIENGFIKITNGKIALIGEMSLVLKNDTEETKDLKGKSVYPGFIDAHCHLGMWEDHIGEEGSDGNEITDPLLPQLRAIDAINPVDRCFEEARQAGVTTVATGPGSANVMSGMFSAVKTVGKYIDDMVIMENVGFKFALGENPKKCYGRKGKTPSTRMGSAALLREQLSKAKKYCDQINLANIDSDEKEPTFDVKCEALIPLIEKDVKAHIHAHRADDILTAIRICNEFEIEYILVHCTEGYMIVDKLLQENAEVIIGPYLSDRSKPELKNLTPESPALMVKGGVHPSICTDHPVTPIQYLPLCAGIAVKEGMKHEDALKSITIIPARQLGLDGRIGSIKEGKDADLIVFDGDPLSVYSKPVYVYINGELVV